MEKKRAEKKHVHPERTEHEFPWGLRESGLTGVETLKRMREFTCTKQTRICKMLGFVVSSVEEGFVSFFVCVPNRGRGVRSARHSIIEKPWICMQGARNIREKSKK